MVTAERVSGGVEDSILLRIKEGEARYGYPASTLYEMAAGGVVPGFVRAGRSVRIHRAIFEEWLATQARSGDANRAA